jgi:hypothetical protein
VPDRGVEVHSVLAEAGIAVQADDLPTANANPTSIVLKGPELSQWPGTKSDHRQP